MAFFNSTSFSQHLNAPTIFDQFPELNQGKRYLQKQKNVKYQMAKERGFIESFSPYNKKGILKKCVDQTQGTSNNTPCRCGNTICGFSTPYCNYQLNTCTGKGANINELSEDWDVKSGCPGDGQFSNCKTKVGCPNYGYCPPPAPTLPLLQWQKDLPDGVSSTLQKHITQQQQTKANYMANVQNYVNNPPKPIFGRNVYVPQKDGPAAPCPTCSPPPINGGWSAWSPSVCPANKKQTRSCTNPAPQYGGSQCIGLNGKRTISETQKCIPPSSPSPPPPPPVSIPSPSPSPSPQKLCCGISASGENCATRAAGILKMYNSAPGNQIIEMDAIERLAALKTQCGATCDMGGGSVPGPGLDTCMNTISFSNCRANC